MSEDLIGIAEGVYRIPSALKLDRFESLACIRQAPPGAASELRVGDHDEVRDGSCYFALDKVLSCRE